MDVPDVPQHDNPSANKPGVMDNSGTLISEQSARKDIITRTLVDFHDSFRLFPLQFDKFCFNHWYWLMASGFLILTVLNTIWDVRVAQLYPGSYHFIRLQNELTSWVNISSVIALVLVLLAFNGWRRNIIPTFQVLLNKGRIYSHSQDTDLAKEYQYFLDAYQNTLLSKKRYILIAVSVIIIFVFLLLTEGNFLYFLLRSRFDALLLIDDSFTVIWYLLSFLFLSYFFGVAS